jgi:FkbM family methyltransferase
MKPYKSSTNTLKEVGRIMSGSLSHLVANPATENLAVLFEIYWSYLLGKGFGGSGQDREFKAEANAAKAFISNSSPILFDVGANLGKWSSLLHAMFPNSRIFLFEPQPHCQRVLQGQKIPDSELIPKAVSSTNGVTTIYIPESSSASGIASLYERLDSSTKNLNFTTIEVETITLDDVIEDYKLSRVDFIKMDIEGHELSALQGASKSLEKGTIKALSFEFGSGNINSRTFFRDFWDLLTPFNYQIYRILPSFRLMPIKDYYEDCEYFRGVSNYVAVLDEP